MTKVAITKSKLDDLALHISAKSGESMPMTIDEMQEAVDGIQTGGNLQAKTRTISAAGTFTDTPDEGYDGLSSVQTTVPEANPFLNLTNIGFFTDGAQRRWRVSPHLEVDSSEGDTPGFLADLTFKTGSPGEWLAVPANTSVSPTESAQTIGGANYMMEGPVTVNAIPSSYVGSGITRRSGSDMTASNLSVTAPAGYYASAGTKTLSDQNLVAENVKKDVTIFGVTGSYEGGGTGLQIGTATSTPSSASQSIQFTGLQGNPTSFYLVARDDLATGSPAKVAAVAFDGTDLHGQTVTNISNAQVSYDDGFTKAFSNGTLTITADTARFQPVEHVLVYTVGGSSANIGTDDVQVGSGATSITFDGLPDEPTCWCAIFKSDFSTSSGYTRTMVVVNDGSSIFGMEMGSGAQATEHWSASYSNGSLVISSDSTSQGGYFHQPGYYELVYAIGGEVEIDIEPLSVTENGTYQQSGKAYSPVVVNVASGGGASVDTKTVTASNRPSTLSFTGMKGEPKMFALRATFTMTSSSSTYYYVDSMRGYLSGTSYSVEGRLFRMGSTRETQAVASGYSASYSNGTLTLTSTGSRTASPGCFYNGSYELVYVY